MPFDNKKISFSQDDMNKLFLLLQNKNINYDFCNFLEDNNYLSYHSSKSSASDTTVFFSDIFIPNVTTGKLPAVAIKAWMSWNLISKGELERFYNDPSVPYKFWKLVQEKENSNYLVNYKALDYEVKVYKYITKNIILTNESNNFVPYIGYVSCSLQNIVNEIKTARNSLSEKDRQKLFETFSLPAKYFPNMKLNLLVTGSLENKKQLPTLYELLNDRVLSDGSLNSIVFQLLHAIYVLEKHRIMHNDLHLDNVFVEVLDEPRTVSLKIDNTIFSFSTHYIPKIFDWDRCYAESFGENPIINTTRYKRMNATNKFGKKRDYYQIICGIVSHSRSDFTDKLIKSITPSPFFKAWNSGSTADPISFQLSKYQIEKSKKIFPAPTNTYDNREKFYNVTKPILESIIPQKTIMRKLDKTRREHFLISDQIYVGLDVALYVLNIYSGRHCMPYNEISNNLLYPLKLLFTDKQLLKNLTLHLKDLKIQ